MSRLAAKIKEEVMEMIPLPGPLIEQEFPIDLSREHLLRVPAQQDSSAKETRGPHVTSPVLLRQEAFRIDPVGSPAALRLDRGLRIANLYASTCSSDPRLVQPSG